MFSEVPLPKKAVQYDAQQERLDRLRTALSEAKGYEEIPLRRSLDLFHPLDLAQNEIDTQRAEIHELNNPSKNSNF